MTDWSSGYVADIGYTFGYYTELNPNRIKLAFLSSNLQVPDIKNACELGFGQGLPINFHAAGSNIKWFGTDFNPAQAAMAKEMNANSGADIVIGDESFLEFASRKDLPKFDYIGLHGIWSWVNDENRRVIVDFVRRHLEVGGVLYISYNTQPGWATFGPVRYLMAEHSSALSAHMNSTANKVKEALSFTDQLLKLNPAYSRHNPGIVSRFSNLKTQNEYYLAHEYFNKDWHPMHFSDVAKMLGQAKLTFACSAHYLDHIDAINVTEEQRKFLAEIPDRNFRETTRDYIVNQQFRRDYWVKGARTLGAFEQQRQLREIRVILINQRAEIKLKAPGALGEADLNKDVYEPILDILKSYDIVSIGNIESLVSKQNLSLAQVVQAIMVLSNIGALAIAQSDDEISERVQYTRKLNEFLMNRAKGSSEINYLASPVTGGGYPVGRFNQLFLAAYRHHENDVDALSKSVWEVIKSQGQRIVKDGNQLESEQDNISELRAQAVRYLNDVHPILHALKIA